MEKKVYRNLILNICIYLNFNPNLNLAAQCDEAIVMGEPYYRTWDSSVFYAHSVVRHTLVRPKRTSEDLPHFVLSLTNR